MLCHPILGHSYPYDYVDKNLNKEEAQKSLRITIKLFRPQSTFLTNKTSDEIYSTFIQNFPKIRKKIFMKDKELFSKVCQSM